MLMTISCIGCKGRALRQREHRRPFGKCPCGASTLTDTSSPPCKLQLLALQLWLLKGRDACAPQFLLTSSYILAAGYLQGVHHSGTKTESFLTGACRPCVPKLRVGWRVGVLRQHELHKPFGKHWGDTRKAIQEGALVKNLPEQKEINARAAVQDECMIWVSGNNL